MLGCRGRIDRVAEDEMHETFGLIKRQALKPNASATHGEGTKTVGFRHFKIGHGCKWYIFQKKISLTKQDHHVLSLI